MFEVYIQEQSVDPRLRNRMMVSLTAAAAFTVAAGIAGWTIDELDIDMVSAPQRFEIATLSLELEPPPPPAPPERPTKAEAAVADQHDHGRPAPKPETERPDSFLETPSSDRRVFSEHGDGEGDGTDDDHRDRIPRD